MKKILLFIAVCLFFQSGAWAKDYVKLQMKEMKEAQKYGTTNKYFADSDEKDVSPLNIEIKDPKIFKLGNYEDISDVDYKQKLAKDEVKYKKTYDGLISKKTDNYNAQAYGKDFYKIYRIAERIIRANNLDFINWRIMLKNDSGFNAYNSDMNYVVIYTGAYDTFADNEDALALLIGHEMGHALLGHSARKAKYINKMERAVRLDDALAYQIAYKRYLAASREMEFGADTEGAKLVARAGYDLSNAKETISFLCTLDSGSDRYATHPEPKKRLKNFNDNKKYFMEQEWVKQGKYNIYNSDVLDIQISSDRHSIIIGKGKRKNAADYYRPETMQDLYSRYAYKSYVNGEFKKAEDYFQKLIKLNKNNPIAYLYLSYTEECLYKQTQNKKYLQNAKDYASYAQRLAPDNSYINKQINDL